MKVLFICGRDPAYVRNSVVLKGLKSQNIGVIECTSMASSYLKRYPTALTKFIIKCCRDYDVIYIGFLGQPLLPIISSLVNNKPIVFDAFISVYDTLCYDRKEHHPSSIVGRLSYWFDKKSCDLADVVLLDTNAHINYFAHTFGLDESKFKRIFTGADDNIFYPRDVKRENDVFNIFYYGTYLPLHGIEHIIHAAKILEKYEDIMFRIVGNGLESQRIMRLAQDLSIRNIEFLDWIPYKELPLAIARADICLGGHFSDIDKGKRVVSGKTFQILATKRPVIVGDNPANRELLTHGENALFAKHANPEDLAEKILELKRSEKLRERIAKNGYATFKEKCTPEAVGSELKKIIENVIY